MSYTAKLTEFVFGCKDLRNNILDFYLDRCPVCERGMPIGWQESRFPEQRNKWKNSKLSKKIDPNLVAIYNGFCSSSCCDTFSRVSELIKSGNPALLIGIDKKLVTNIKKLTPCEGCHIPLTPRQVENDKKRGGSLKGCGTNYGLSFRDLPWILQKNHEHPETAFVCDQCYEDIEDACAEISISKDFPY